MAKCSEAVEKRLGFEGSIPDKPDKRKELSK
jgi:hypothetical protein